MMKKAVSFLLLLAMLCPAISCAESPTTQAVTYYIPELELSIAVPPVFLCTTREAKGSEPFYRAFGYGPDDVKSVMESQNSYLFGLLADGKGELSLMQASNGVFDLDTIGEADIMMAMNSVKSSFEMQGGLNVTAEVYQGKSHKAIIIRCEYMRDNTKVYFLQYTFTHGDKAMFNLRLNSDNEISIEMEEGMRNAFDSIMWGKVENATGTKGSTDQSIFTDHETGLTFLIPSGWTETDFVGGAESKKVKYRVGEDSIWVIYESTDLWTRLSAGSFGIARTQIQNDYFSQEDIAQSIGSVASEVSMKTIGDQEYFCVRFTTATDVSSTEIGVENVLYVCVRDGFLYWFQLSGAGIEKCEDQFNRFMKTVEFKDWSGESIAIDLSRPVENVAKYPYSYINGKAIETGTYTGETVDGYPHGYGVFESEQWFYIGDWEKGQPVEKDKYY